MQDSLHLSVSLERLLAEQCRIFALAFEKDANTLQLLDSPIKDRRQQLQPGTWLSQHPNFSPFYDRALLSIFSTT